MIFIGTHHKTGTILFQSVFTDISHILGLRMFVGRQQRLPPDTGIWFMPHSRISPDELPGLKGVHVVRHPHNVIKSAYRYHKTCQESWAIDINARTGADGINYNFDGLSYQQHLNLVNEHDGLLVEMRGRSFNALMDAYAWDYADRRFLNVRLEDITTDFDGCFRAIFEWLELPVQTCLDIARCHDLARMTPEAIVANLHITDKRRRGASIDELDPALLDQFSKLYPADLISRLGYAGATAHFPLSSVAAAAEVESGAAGAKAGRYASSPFSPVEVAGSRDLTPSSTSPV